MIFKSTDRIPTFLAGDKTQIKEILHPKNDGLNIAYSLAEASLDAGQASLPHILSGQSELYYVLEGVGTVFVNDESCAVKKGDILLIPAGARQHVENQGTKKLRFLCIVSPPWKAADEIIL